MAKRPVRGQEDALMLRFPVWQPAAGDRAMLVVEQQWAQCSAQLLRISRPPGSHRGCLPPSPRASQGAGRERPEPGRQRARGQVHAGARSG